MKISGVNGKVLYGSVVVAEMVSWSMSGISQPTASAPTAFGDTGAKVKEVTELPDPGTNSTETTTHQIRVARSPWRQSARWGRT
jgi:hypothetical protein